MLVHKTGMGVGLRGTEDEVEERHKMDHIAKMSR